MLRHPLIRSLLALRGNPRACVYTEPLFNIPFQLISPYASVYMIALGLHDAQIGLLASISLAAQMILSLVSGAITDKFGRRWTTFFSDLVSWGIPVLILAAAQNFTYFLIATILMAFWRIPHTSWTCLMVEDAREDQLVHIWTWVYITGQLSVFFAPIAGLLINRYTLIPTMRGLYLFAFVLMMTKFFVLLRYSTETERGRIRMEETRGKPLLSLLAGYPQVLKQMLANPRTVVALALLVVMTIIQTVNNNFWSIFVTRQLSIPEAHLALFPFVRSIIMLFGFFIVTQRLTSARVRRPMLLGYLAMFIAALLLITMPPQNYILLILAVILDAGAVTLIAPLLESVVVISIDAQERARVMAIFYTLVLLFTTPFGWIAGKLSEANRILPFILNMGLFVIAAILVLIVAKLTQSQKTTALPTGTD